MCFSLSFLNNFMSFSISNREFGSRLRISSVKAPLPGPISIIFFLISDKLIILFIIFLSIKNFCLEDFLKLHHINLFKNFIHFIKLSGSPYFS